jgi:hypothetical protein
MATNFLENFFFNIGSRLVKFLRAILVGFGILYYSGHDLNNGKKIYQFFRSYN